MSQHVHLHIVTLNMSGSEMAQKVLQEAVVERTFAAILTKRVKKEHLWTICYRVKLNVVIPIIATIITLAVQLVSW